jgi:hypothetical protein
LVSDGAGGTKVYFDPHNGAWPYAVTTLDHVSPSSLTPSDWGQGASTPTAPPPNTPPPPTNPPPPTTTPGVTLTAPTTGGTLTGGAGNDTLIAGQGATTMTGAAGSDTFVFQKLPWSSGHITDFTPGVDKIDIHALFTTPYSGTDPVADGFVSLASDGAGGTKVYFNSPAQQWPWLITTLDHVAPTSLHASDWLVH